MAEWRAAQHQRAIRPPTDQHVTRADAQNIMYRPTRTRRLSIAAMASTLALALVAGAEIRSFRTYDCWKFRGWRAVALGNGCVMFWRWSGDALGSVNEPPAGYQSGDIGLGSPIKGLRFGTATRQVATRAGNAEFFTVWVPLWFLLLPLLITPMLWLIARPVGGMAFPVIPCASRTTG